MRPSKVYSFSAIEGGKILIPMASKRTEAGLQIDARVTWGKVKHVQRIAREI